MPENKIAVIGVGNTLRRDDGVGILILESLLNCYKRQEIAYFNFGIASFDLLHKLADYETVVLIDAIEASIAPGELKIFELKDVESSFKNTAVSSHELNLIDLRNFCDKFDIKTKIYVAGIQVVDISFGEGLSEALKIKLEAIIEEISLFIEKIAGKI